MADAITAVETAIAEVTRARKLIAKGKSKQVRSNEEITLLKAVVYAWLNNHREGIISHHSKPDLGDVGLAYKAILDATGGHATRATYLGGLLQVKDALVVVRGKMVEALPVPLGAATPETPPNFAPLAGDATMQVILQRRWTEVQNCMLCKSQLAATVMMGGLLESLLLARMNGSQKIAAVYTAAAAPRDKKTGKTLPFGDWKLIHMVEVGHELKWITKGAKDVGNVLRDFRNYIHPHKEYADKLTLHEEDTKMFWEVTKSITRQVLASVGQTP